MVKIITHPAWTEEGKRNMRKCARCGYHHYINHMVNKNGTWWHKGCWQKHISLVTHKALFSGGKK